MFSFAFVNTSLPSTFVQFPPARHSVAKLSQPRRLDSVAPSSRKQRSFLLRRFRLRAQSDSNDQKQSTSSKRPLKPPQKPEQTFFGFRLRTNGDVVKFGIVATVVPLAIKAGLQAAGVEDLKAGQLTTGFVSVFALLAWISTYVFRVGTKQMTYAQQLRDYEDQVIQKRYEELTDEELAALNEELKEES